MGANYSNEVFDMDLQEETIALTRFLSVITKGSIGLSEATALIEHFGSVCAMTAFPAPALVRTGHLSEMQAELLTQLPDIVRRCLLDRCGSRPCLQRLTAAADYARALYTGARNEQFRLLCLDDKYNLIDAFLLSSGSLRETSVPPRVVMETALHANARAVIFCHNHPGGRTFFSEADVSSTRASMRYMDGLNIALLDHLLIAGRRTASLRGTRYIPEREWIQTGALSLPYADWIQGFSDVPASPSSPDAPNAPDGCDE